MNKLRHGFLQVSRIISKEVMHDFVLDYCQRLGWIPGKMDDELYWIPGPEGTRRVFMWVNLMVKG